MKHKLFLLLVIPAVIMFSCAREDRAGKKYTVGLSLDSLVVERWQRDLESFSRAASDLDMELLIRIANQNAETQIEQIREMVASGIDVLVVIPNDAKKLTEVIKQVKRKKIPVISYDRLVSDANVDLYISFDNEQVGALMAEAAAKARPQGSYVIVNGAVSDNNAFMIHSGFMRVLNPLAQRGDIRLLEEIWPNEWTSEEVRPRFEAALAKFGAFDVVLCGNDMLAETVIAVLSENRMLGSTIVLGQDAELAACQRVAERTQYATIYKPVELLALKAAGFALMLAKKEKLDTEQRISDGTYSVAYVKLAPIVVTADNLLDTVIRDGFHSKADVYRNVK